MLDGRIDTQGTVKELRAQGVLDEITHEATVEVKKEELAVAVETVDPGTVEEQVEAKKPRKLVEDEHRGRASVSHFYLFFDAGSPETGSVKWPVYREYLAASSYYIWALLALLVIAQQLKSVSEKVWIKIWSEAYGTPGNASDAFIYRSLGNNELFLTDNLQHTAHVQSDWRLNSLAIQLPSASDRPMFYIGVYAAIGMFGIVLQLTSVALQYTGALRASRILFK